jgi:hypothetical protein
MIASGAKMLMFSQTSSSSSCAISELPSSRSRLDSSAGISSAAAELLGKTKADFGRMRLRLCTKAVQLQRESIRAQMIE